MHWSPNPRFLPSCLSMRRRQGRRPRLPGAGVEHATRANDAALRSAASSLPVQAIDIAAEP